MPGPVCRDFDELPGALDASSTRRQRRGATTRNGPAVVLRRPRCQQRLARGQRARQGSPTGAPPHEHGLSSASSAGRTLSSQRWHDTPEDERTAPVLQEALDHGLRQERSDDVLDADGLPGSAAARECEEALPPAQRAGRRGRLPPAPTPTWWQPGWDPVRHFTRHGWRTMREPQPGLRPVVVLGRAPRPRPPGPGRPAGPRRPRGPPGGAVQPPAPRYASARGRPADRPRSLSGACALFAAYDPDGVVDDSVIDYVRELAGSPMSTTWRTARCRSRSWPSWRSSRWVPGVTARTYDFGSYSRPAEIVGWETIEQYDELLLVNDSCFLLRPLDEVFARMDARACDWWGLQATKHRPRRVRRGDEVAAAADRGGSSTRFRAAVMWHQTRHLLFSRSSSPTGSR